jgi:hypothetical protein
MLNSVNTVALFDRYLNIATRMPAALVVFEGGLSVHATYPETPPSNPGSTIQYDEVQCHVMRNEGQRYDSTTTITMTDQSL